MSPISSRNSVPPSACSKRPRRSESAPVKDPFSWPNSSDSSSSPGMAEVFSAMKALLARGEWPCSARAASSLPVPDSPVTSTFTLERDRRPMARNICCMAGALPSSSDICTGRRGFRGTLIHLRGAAHQVHGLVDVEGLGQVFERAALVGGHRAAQVGVRRHHDDGQSRVPLVHIAQQFQARLARHADVGHQHIGRFAAQRGQRGFGGLEQPRHHARILQGAFQHPADRSVVVDQPDAQRITHSLPPSRGSSSENTVRPGWLVNSMMPP